MLGYCISLGNKFLTLYVIMLENIDMFSVLDCPQRHLQQCKMQYTQDGNFITKLCNL